MYGPDGDDWSLDDLLRTYDEPEKRLVSIKWQLNRRTWRTGDVPGRPLNLHQLAQAIGRNDDETQQLDERLVGKLRSHPMLARTDLRFLAWKVEEAGRCWDQEWGATHLPDGRLRRLR
jgi:hypothetical protein